MSSVIGQLPEFYLNREQEPLLPGEAAVFHWVIPPTPTSGQLEPIGPLPTSCSSQISTSTAGAVLTDIRKSGKANSAKSDSYQRYLDELTERERAEEEEKRERTEQEKKRELLERQRQEHKTLFDNIDQFDPFLNREDDFALASLPVDENGNVVSGLVYKQQQQQESRSAHRRASTFGSACCGAAGSGCGAAGSTACGGAAGSGCSGAASAGSGMAGCRGTAFIGMAAGTAQPPPPNMPACG